MSRIFKEEEYTSKRNEILDAAQKLVYTKGFEQMSIQDILDDLGISKGAFYHYFNSKQELLEALTDRMATEVEKILLPIVEDPTLAAQEKLQLYFNTAANWKTTQKPFIMALLRIWYADDNTIVRQKLLSVTVNRVGPAITKIVKQGIEEGVFNSRYPDQIGEILPAVAMGLTETMIRLLLSVEEHPELRPALEAHVDAYLDTLERILGAPSGSFALNGSDWLKNWMAATEDGPPDQTIYSQEKITDPRERA